MSFSLNDLLSAETMKDSKRTERTVAMIAADKLHPSEDNFYSMDDERIKKMAASILMLSTPGKIGIQQNLVVSPIQGTDEYTILTGETRWRAVMQLIENGDLDTDKIPCEVQTEDDPVRDELILILTNSTQRDRSDAEKMHEIKRLRVLLEEYKKQHKLSGTIQKAIGDILGISKTKVGTLENIDRNLSPELLEEYENGNINTSVANKLAGLDAEAQLAGKEMLAAKGSITADDVRVLTDREDKTEPKERPIYKKCITGWSKYGNCNCCGKGGVPCCNQCQESCNVRCGWIDNPYIPANEEKTVDEESVPYEMEYEVSDNLDDFETEESVCFNMNLAEKNESVSGQKPLNDDVPGNDQWYHPELINNLREILSLGCITADTKSFVQAAADRVLKTYQTLNGNPVFVCPGLELVSLEQDGSKISLETFVYDFYNEVVNMVLKVIDSSDLI